MERIGPHGIRHPNGILFHYTARSHSPEHQATRATQSAVGYEMGSTVYETIVETAAWRNGTWVGPLAGDPALKEAAAAMTDTDWSGLT